MKRTRHPNLEPSAPGSIRGKYEQHGSDEYYRREGGTYRNPHEPAVRDAILRSLHLWPCDLAHVLDLAAGSGEATLALRNAGAERIEGIDPYTHRAYLARTGKPAEQMTFDQIAAGGLTGRRYSLIVCSFALHLCEPSRLPGVCSQLAAVSPALLVLAPHKRPVIQAQWGWRLLGEEVWQRVRCRMYRSGFQER